MSGATSYDPENYVPTIDAILNVSDLEQITVKKMRNALQELFAIDLQPHKQEINTLIMNRYHKLVDERTEEEENAAKKKKIDLEKQDELIAARLQASFNTRTRRGESKSKITKKKSSNKKKDGSEDKRAGPNNPFNKPMKLSPKLASLLNVDLLSRPQVVKQMWDYIKANDLQNPNDKREIVCDDNLSSLFGKKSVTMFEMNKILSKHIFSPDELVGAKQDDVSPEVSKTPKVKNEKSEARVNDSDTDDSESEEE